MYCYYLLIFKSWRNFPAINTKGYAKMISTSISMNIRYNLIAHLQNYYTENIYVRNNMKNLALILIFLSIAGCSFNTRTKETASTSFKAVYFYQKEAQLSLEDLQAHPEVAVVQTFDEFKQYAHKKIALWIDKSATPFNPEEEKWINEAPQTYYPIVLIGTSDTLHAFRDLLRLDGFMGPAIYPGMNAPGFSVIQWESKDNLGFHALIQNGYNQKPTVQAILEITNALLEGRLKPTPISTLPKPARQIATSETRQIILYNEEPRNGFPNDAAKINWLSLGNNILTIDIAYQGDCQAHTFELYAWTAFLESNPQQGVLFLSHDSHGDTCTENVEQELSFDLTPLNQERTDPRDHPLLLRIIEPVDGSFAKEPVMPLIEWP